MVYYGTNTIVPCDAIAHHPGALRPISADYTGGNFRRLNAAPIADPQATHRVVTCGSARAERTDLAGTEISALTRGMPWHRAIHPAQLSWLFLFLSNRS
jgi:hypothetical protein